MTAALPPAEPLVGRFIRLTPFEAADVADLAVALRRPEVFAGGYGGGPAGMPADDAGFERFALGYYASAPDAMAWTVRLRGGQHDGRVVGATKFGDIDLPNESAHIGWTGYDPRVWGSGVNVEAKLLLLGAAFDHGFGRVKLQADNLNARSRAAILRLGATFEGLARRDKRRADGTWRSSAVYSILVDEWPAVRDGLEARLAARGDAPVELREAEPIG
ncbi:RimJ/RimL family protein N-acetyltransferase [Agromyces terreus]|uniref:RimJ/RimL family protein N-acetyltransferase n=1 Tax=Agromyces terreus TaxID=424795 RepID=A0A9X2H4F6_9MICO|nr:GNAT family protein [Agromyces terreus]MCP2370607.1 RimJ/RimL family protein N-acetyltransferase [Agromyces terreus]